MVLDSLLNLRENYGIKVSGGDRMKRNGKKFIRDGLLTVLLQVLAFGAALLIDSLFGAEPLMPLFFVLASFLAAQLTDGYFWGIVSSFISVLAVNFAFTYPYFAFNFEIAENAVSALIILAVSISTCALTQKIRKHEMLRAEFGREKMRGNLLRAVSHDLRTPLTGIYGASSAMADNYDVLSDEDKLQMLRGIQEDSQWLIRMVENLLSITKVGNDNVKLSKSSGVVEELVGSALQKFQQRYPGQAVELQIPDEFITISVDPILIEQVLVNLLENAVQHAKGMTKLSLKVLNRDPEVIFEVADNGCGIPKDRLPDIFSGTATPDTGTAGKRSMGIGLSVCATIIRAHGGTVYAEPAKGGGMRFGFRLEAEEIIHE